MAGQRQPIALVQAKGKKHLTKAEIAEREQTEVKAPSSDAAVIPDSYAEKGIQKNGERTAGDRPDFKLGRGSTGAVSDRAGEIQRSDRNDRKAATDGNCGIRHREKRCRRLSDHGRT